MAGKVYLVGAGPGDPGLLTVRAQELLRQAEVVVYDRLAETCLAGNVRPDAELVYVGKQPGQPALSQEAINALLVARAREGKQVVRLKGGDPFLFGRGGEEAEALVAAGIPFEVVPGVTSALAVPAYAGIPVTHRGLSSSVAIVTGHEDPSKGETSVRWEHLARAVETLVILMGTENLPAIVERLLRAGRSPDTPAAAIQWGTLPHQRVISAPLARLPAVAREAGLGAPAVIVIGPVAALHPYLRWFSRPPLAGRRILVTRAQDQAGALVQALRAAGAVPIELPAIVIVPVDDETPIRQAIARLAEYDWVIFTSQNGVARFFAVLQAMGGDARAFGRARLAAIGPATAAALAARGLRADLVPPAYVAEAVAEALIAQGIAGRRLLLARAAEARPVLPERLRAAGATVEVLPLYRTVPPLDLAERARALLTAEKIDIVTFTSASTVRHLVAALGGTDLLRSLTVACIGPVTAQAAAELGLRVDIVAPEHTIPGLVEALIAHESTRTLPEGGVVQWRR